MRLIKRKKGTSLMPVEGMDMHELAQSRHDGVSVPNTRVLRDG
jgi:hypothetical protein